MYTGTAGTNVVMEDERELYLLGKRRLDRLVDQGQSAREMNAGAAFQRGNAYGMAANSLQITQAKVREDPLFAIRRREQALFKSALNNPVELKRLKGSKVEKSKGKQRKRRFQGSKVPSPSLLSRVSSNKKDSVVMHITFVFLMFSAAVMMCNLITSSCLSDAGQEDGRTYRPQSDNQTY
ncbi:hypothetical protein DFS34DRAFT_236921 [Phlyctochytrium arcticum]|nr:hypothetical protein DFS34DRAFT_236921 [Phlyctochytrium arcticum]